MRPMSFPYDALTKKEHALFTRLTTPQKIQTYLDSLPINFEKGGDTHYSPRAVFSLKKAHCVEGALLAAAVLWFHGEKPLLMNFKVDTTKDFEHVVAIYMQNGYVGAISKTNHAVLRYRDPIYKTARELALSYFHEYYLGTTGEKTLLAYSKPYDVRHMGSGWVTAPDNVWDIDRELDRMPHHSLVPPANRMYLRPATKFERQVTNRTEWREA
jgi:hypothetical protein